MFFNHFTRNRIYKTKKIMHNSIVMKKQTTFFGI